jgi:hypothetical protein
MSRHIQDSVSRTCLGPIYIRPIVGIFRTAFNGPLHACWVPFTLVGIFRTAFHGPLHAWVPFTRLALNSLDNSLQNMPAVTSSPWHDHFRGIVESLICGPVITKAELSQFTGPGGFDQTTEWAHIRRYSGLKHPFNSSSGLSMDVFQHGWIPTEDFNLATTGLEKYQFLKFRRRTDLSCGRWRH